FDDLLDIPQTVKSISPLFAALPLVAIRAGATSLKIPVFGYVEFGIIYPLLLVPLGVTGAANAVNMLAGFNGMELGVGLVAFVSLGVVAWVAGSHTALIILIAGI
ncbi:MAG: glycosyl transferase family 4, partial [Candidatus Bipolaricaulia bacterium]